MDQSLHAALRRSVRQHIDALLTVLDDLGRHTEGLSSVVRTTLQDAMADLEIRLQAFDDLVASSLGGTNADTEAQDALTRLIEQVHTRQQELEDQLRRLSDASAEDWESRMVRLEAAWSQLDKTARIALQELAPRPRPEDAQ